MFSFVAREQVQIFQQSDNMFQEKSVRQDKAYLCSHCDFKTKHNTNMKKHVESKHSDYRLKIFCLFCYVNLPTRTALRTHVKRKHPRVKLCSRQPRLGVRPPMRNSEPWAGTISLAIAACKRNK